MDERDQAQRYFMARHDLNFWLWACLHDGEVYLAASRDFRSVITKRSSGVGFPLDMQAFQEALTSAQQKTELAQYHFVTTTGSLLRNLKRSQHIFPIIQPAYSRASHLISEAKDIRDMIEHADDYETGSPRAKKPGEFVRESEAGQSLPGDRPGQASATGTIVDDSGHWIGGRLNVERVLSEVRAIAEEAAKIPRLPPQAPS